MIELLPQVTCTPNPGGQEKFATDFDNFIVGLEGGWFSGKSYIGARKLITLHLINAFDEEGLATFVPSMVVAPTYSNAMDFCVPHLQDALEENNIGWKWISMGTTLKGKYAGPLILIPEFGSASNPSVILVRTADTPKRITGVTIGAAWGDEPPRWKEDRMDPKEDAFIQLMGRVRHPLARIKQINLTYTNEGTGTRVYEELNSNKPDIALYRASTDENPAAEDFYEQQIRLLNKDLVKQYLKGEAVSLRGGALYPSFSEELHVDSRLKLDEHLPLHLSLDFNISPGMHGELGHYNQAEDLFTVVHEIYGPRMSVRELVPKLAEIIKKDGGWKWQELHIFGDATGKAANAGTGESCYDILRNGLDRLGFPYRLRVPSSNPLIVDRVNAFEAALLDFSDKVHFQCHPRCERLITDLKTMKHGDKTANAPEISHASSAEGYRISYLRPIRITRPILGRHAVGVIE